MDHFRGTPKSWTPSIHGRTSGPSGSRPPVQNGGLKVIPFLDPRFNRNTSFSGIKSLKNRSKNGPVLAKKGSKKRGVHGFSRFLGSILDPLFDKTDP